ncbi:MAG: methionine ABC transporter ATP-binding protein [Bacilli bacterium]|nr:methionine ABC transporter ATP-binding protein [Bacilli bacterium]MBO6285514.1 methionine ABC transporter ATP-binding protein [Bacilli bacterium]
MPEIEIRNLQKSFAGKTVLHGVDLSVEKGDVFGVLGLSGAGKSTLVRCINGLEIPDGGEIYFQGQLICSASKRIEPQYRRKIAMIFQQFNLLEQRTVLQNVELALEISKVKDKKVRHEKALECLRRVGLEDKAKSYPSSLSGGQKQRVAIARSLALEPQVLLSDEATSALDPETTQSILALLKQLNKELGLTIIMISHQLGVIESICNKVAILDKAKLVECGDLSDVFLNPKTDIARNLIYADQVHTELNEHHFIRLLFDGNADEPIIANIVQQCSILVSIVYASTKVIDGKVYGQTVIKRPKNPAEREKLFKYLRLHNVSYEEVKSLGLE